MTGGTHAQRILALLSATPDLDDDAVAKELSITPRQTVNQICRRLAAQGVLVRLPGAGGKIVNRLADGNGAAAAPAVARKHTEPRVRARFEGMPLCERTSETDPFRTKLLTHLC